MRRVLLVGLPRSGTTWLARMLSGPDVRLIHEPDNRGLEPLAWAATQGLGPIPSLTVGDRAPDYRRLWDLAFAGGWPDDRRVRAVRRAARAPLLPRRTRSSLELAAARLAVAVSTPPPIVLVKTVAAQLAAEWLAHEFDPTMIVVWRHPLNLVPSWQDQGWVAPLAQGLKAVRDRFAPTAAWPPLNDDGIGSVAWSVCAQSVILLEAASRHPDWLVVSHERQCLDPPQAFRTVIDRLGLPERPDLVARLAESDRPGTGFEVRRNTAMEPGRWRRRLNESDRRAVLDTVQRFAATSEVADAAWSSSPALAPAEDESAQGSDLPP